MISFYKLYHHKKKNRRQNLIAGFDSSAMADLAFLLLIFFIVTSSFILRQGIFFSLPSKTAGAMPVSSRDLINLYPQNKGYYLEKNKLNRQNLLGKLAEIKQKNSNPILIIHMRPEVKYSRLVDALSVAKEIGLKKISLKDYSD